MIQLTCISKARQANSGNIIGYRLQRLDINKVIDMQPNQLKELIRKRQVCCTNLKLTADNRLIDKNTEKDDGEKYYRYTIYKYKTFELVGGLFRGINVVLDEVNEWASDGDEIAIDDYEDINRLEAQLEYILKCPNIDREKHQNIMFFFKQEMNDRIVQRISDINEMIERYEFTIKRTIVTKKDICRDYRIVYDDMDQIGIERRH